jgi:hypothetical protein
MIAPALCNQESIGIVEVEIAGELDRRGFVCIAAIPRKLGVGQEINRHG